MYNVTIYFFESKLLLLGHVPNLVGHCPMSDSNLQPLYCSNGNFNEFQTALVFERYERNQQNVQFLMPNNFRKYPLKQEQFKDFQALHNKLKDFQGFSSFVYESCMKSTPSETSRMYRYKCRYRYKFNI